MPPPSLPPTPIKQRKHSEHSGEPGCRTLEEVNKFFRNFWDPTAYWECTAQGKPATVKRCPQAQLFSDKHSKCVHYTEWEWTDPTEPPSRPK